MTVERRDLFGAQDAAEALRLLAARARMAADLDEHVGLRDVDAVIAHLGQEQRVDLRRIKTEGPGQHSVHVGSSGMATAC